MGNSSGTSRAKCQVCGKTWPSDHSICPDDGSWLYDETMVEILPRSRRVSLDGGLSEITNDITTRTRQQTPAYATPIRRATTDVIAAQLAAAAAPEDLPVGTMIGEYEVEAKVGEGAMGAVYRAVHPQIGLHVAIKVMTARVFGEAESVKRFVGEARAVAAIEHPSIVDVFGFGRLGDGRTYLVMEWLDGESLASAIKRGPLDFTDVCEIVRQIARALEAAHSKGIIHRDLKPENIFFKKIDDDRPTVKLLDFGLAKSMNKDEPANVAKTRSGQMLGTPLYMSPEQCKNKGVDHRTDIYALGCICYELVCGRTPFDADNVAEIISAHLVGQPPRPSQLKPDIAPELDHLLFDMIQKDPARRPALADVRRAFGAELSRHSGFMDIASTPFATPLPYGGATTTGTMRPATPPPGVSGQMRAQTAHGIGPPTGPVRTVTSPVRAQTAPAAVATPRAQTAPVASPPVASTPLDAWHPGATSTPAPARTGPPWFFYAAVIVLLAVVAVILAVK